MGGSSLGENALLMQKSTENSQIVTQIALVITKIWRRTSLSAQHLEP